MSASFTAVPIGQDVFLQQFNESSGPSASILRLPESALIALPYIGALVGVDQQIPSKVIYAIYDPEGPGLRYVHGDGAFVHAENVCFMNRFTGGSQCRPDLAPRQRTHFIELLKRSAFYYQTLLFPNTMEYAKIKVEFPNPTAVKEALTYLQDLNLGKDACPALKQIPSFSPSDPCIQDQSVPCITLSSTPTWDFRPSISFQARVSRNQEAELLKKHKEFVQKYQCQMSFFDFQQSTFCLVGLVNENLISFHSEKPNDAWDLETGGPSNFRELVRPLRTAAGWTLDCFLARFGKFEKFVEKLGLSCPPSPVNWLEAELDDEKRLERSGRIRRLIKPWKGTIYGKVVPGVLEWEFLQTLVWQNGGDEEAGIRRYPRPFESVRWSPLTTEEIIRSRPNLEDDARKKLEAELKKQITKERVKNRFRESRRNGKRRVLSQPVWDEEGEGDTSSDSLGNPDTDNLPETLNSHEQNGESSFQEHDTIESEVTLSDEDMYDASDREISHKRKHTRSISSPDEEKRPLKRKIEYLLGTDTDQDGDMHTNTDNQETQQPLVTSSPVTGMDVLSNIFGSDTQQKSTAKSPRISEPPIITGMDILSDIFGPRTITKNAVTAMIKQEPASKKCNEGESSIQLGCDKRRKINGSLQQQASSVTSSHSITNEEGDTGIEATNTNKELPWISHERKLRGTKTTRTKRRRSNEHNKAENLSFDSELRDNNVLQLATLVKNEDRIGVEDQVMVSNLSIAGVEYHREMSLDESELILQDLSIEEDEFSQYLITEYHGERSEHRKDIDVSPDAPEITQLDSSVEENQIRRKLPIENKEAQFDLEEDRDMSLDARQSTQLDLSSELREDEIMGKLSTQDNEKQSSQEEDYDPSLNKVITETEQTLYSKQCSGDITSSTREVSEKERSTQELAKPITQNPITEEIIPERPILGEAPVDEVKELQPIPEESELVIEQEVKPEEYDLDDEDFNIQSSSCDSFEPDEYIDTEGEENVEDAHISWNGKNYFRVHSFSIKDNYDEEPPSQEHQGWLAIAQTLFSPEETGQIIQNGVDSAKKVSTIDSTTIKSQSYSGLILSQSDIKHMSSTKLHISQREQQESQQPPSPYKAPGLPNNEPTHENYAQSVLATLKTSPSPSSSTSTSSSSPNN